VGIRPAAHSCPVVVRDEIDYRREVDLLQEIEVTLSLAGLAPDGGRWLVQSDILREQIRPSRAPVV